MALSTTEYINLLKEDKHNLEIVNSDLLRRLEIKEHEIVAKLIKNIRYH